MLFSQVLFLFRELQFDCFRIEVNLERVLMGQKQIYDHQINNDRIDPLFVKQFNENPYTQKLSSHIIPYNPKSIEK